MCKTSSFWQMSVSDWWTLLEWLNDCFQLCWKSSNKKACELLAINSGIQLCSHLDSHQPTHKISCSLLIQHHKQICILSSTRKKGQRLVEFWMRAFHFLYTNNSVYQQEMHNLLPLVFLLQNCSCKGWIRIDWMWIYSAEINFFS